MTQTISCEIALYPASYTEEIRKKLEKELTKAYKDVQAFSEIEIKVTLEKDDAGEFILAYVSVDNEYYIDQPAEPRTWDSPGTDAQSYDFLHPEDFNAQFLSYAKEVAKSNDCDFELLDYSCPSWEEATEQLSWEEKGY